MSKLEQALELNTIIEEVSQLASFSLGKKRILALEPSYKPLVINRNLLYTKVDLRIIHKNFLCPFYGMKDLTLVFSQAKKGSLLSATDINDVKQFLLGIQAIVRFYDSLQEVKLEYISELFQSLIEYPKLIQHIDHCIDDYGAVLDTASMELKGIRLSLKKVDMEITQAVQRFIQTHKDSVVDAIVAYRNDRAVILVKSSDKNQFGGLSYGESASGQASYIEPAAVLHLNNRKQELLSKEKEEIERVLRQLSNEIATVSDSLLANLDTVSILDEIFAKALWGQKHDAVCADIQKGNDYILVKARHPLIDPKKVVANTYRIADGKKMLLITGPNTGGKTVSLKILGLFVLMSYCGIPVPAEEAHLPFFDQVFEDIGDDQSVISSLSSFSAHIQKQAYITNHATVNSLVLLDELGSGTDPKEGESLGIALLNHLREIGCITIVTTHFSRLKAYGKRHEDILLASVQFDMDKLMPTYRYIQGLTGQSNAINVAKRYGLPKEVIKYARFLMKQSDSEEDTLISKLEEQLNEVEANNLKLQEQLTALQKEKDELHKQKIQFQKEKDL
ncbi:MAG: endonuclease MutS2, partial [Solobacterium sp.]|nr:endonuclease MutS2 [Solobacterium sp.]